MRMVNIFKVICELSCTTRCSPLPFHVSQLCDNDDTMLDISKSMVDVLDVLPKNDVLAIDLAARDLIDICRS